MVYRGTFFAICENRVKIGSILGAQGARLGPGGARRGPAGAGLEAGSGPGSVRSRRRSGPAAGPGSGSEAGAGSAAAGPGSDRRK